MISTVPPRTPRLFVLAPRVVLRANASVGVSPSYPSAGVAYDNVTTGSHTDLQSNMLLTLGTTPGGDDLGRVRVGTGHTGSMLRTGFYGRGVHDGELLLVDNAYLTVYDDRRVWAKLPYIDAGGAQFKDGNLSVGDNGTMPPPVAVMGAAMARTADADTLTLTVLFNGQPSYAVAEGATIVSHAWDISDGTLTTGTLADDNITATFPVGFRYVTLTVTDSNGQTHTSARPVFVDHPTNRQSLAAFQIENHTITADGQELSVRLLADLPRGVYPDGTLAIIWDDEPAGAANRDHILFVGWLDMENSRVVGGETGFLRDSVLRLVDIGGRLNRLPGFPQTLTDETLRDEELEPETTWQYMEAPTLDKFMHYILQWHSTALEVADVYLSGTGADYPFVELQAAGESLYSQVARLAAMLCPDHKFVTNYAGQMRVVRDLNLLDPADRPTGILLELDAREWSEVGFEYDRHPRVHTLWGHATLAAIEYDESEDQPIVTQLRSVAPGAAWSQGTSEVTHTAQLARSQEELNAVTGHRYARLNSRFGPLTLRVHGNINRYDLDMTVEKWVRVIMPAPYAARRGVNTTVLDGLLKGVSVGYTYRETGITYQYDVTLELASDGPPAYTWHVDDGAAEPGDGTWSPPVIGEPWSPPLPGDESVYYDDIAAYILWSGDRVFRTWDLQAASPTWERVDTGISGNILDGQYVHANETTVGMWLLTSAGVFWCGNIMATTPSWSHVLNLTTIRAAEVQPSGGDSQFGAMFHFWLQPGHLCVATQPTVNNTAAYDFPHAYFWVTENFGATWTMVDMDAFTFTSGTVTRGYYQIGHKDMNAFRSEPYIFALRSTGRTGTSTGRTAVFISNDGGYTWSKGHEFTTYTHFSVQGGLLNPFPDFTSPAYVTKGGTSSTIIRLYKTTDAFATLTEISGPTGYTHAPGAHNRPNQRTGDDDHIIALWRESLTGDLGIYESFNQGATWSALRTGISVTFNDTPNGWPPDVDQWVAIARGATAGNRLFLTLDNFANWSSKEGNLGTVGYGSWPGSGFPGGFALPRIGPNA